MATIMKELSIEEKAKAYDEAIEKAKSLYKAAEPMSGCKVLMEAIFPELKESEDEQHRKWILKYLYDGLRKSDEQFKGQFKAAIAWLEKQESEPKWCHHEVDLSGCSEEYRKGYYDGWNNCNQQHAQLEAEQKPAWSEEDEKHIKILIGILDERLNSCDEGSIVYDVYKGEQDWLKSLKERYTWKPSELQLECLCDAIRNYNNRGYDAPVLKELLEDLKKLTE